MEKQKVTVEFQNKFCDKLYNTVQKAEFDWLKRFAPDKKEHWNNLIGTVDFAIYQVIKEFFDNSETKEILEKTLNSMLPDIDLQKIFDGCE